MIECNIYTVLRHVQSHINKKTREDLLMEFIQERLNLSLNTYDRELKMSLDFLERRKSVVYLARKINKLM